jgi:hypothetical protein
MGKAHYETFLFFLFFYLPLRFVAISDLYEPIDDGSESQVKMLSQSALVLAVYPRSSA